MPDPSSGRPKIRVMVIDDHPVVRQGLVAAMNAEPDITVVAEGSTGEEGIRLFRQHQPDVTVMDLMLPGMGGAKAVQEIRAARPRARVLILTTYQDHEQLLVAFDNGARGCALKGSPISEILQALRTVHAGFRWIPPEIAERLEKDSAIELTAREKDVLGLVAQGQSNRDIAALLGISADTVKDHIENARNKLGAPDRAAAVAIALKRGLIT
jgi:two-component system, NarL family, response regulator